MDEDILIQAGIEKAEAVAAVSPDENINIMVSQIAREIYNVPRVIPRVYDPDRDIFFQQLGLNTMCLTTLAVAHVKKILEQTTGDISLTFGNKSIGFRYIKPDPQMEGKTVREINNSDRMIFGIIKDEEFIFASPNYKIHKNNLIVLAEYI
ncbi:MAG: NAD-binding protein [Actinobacteria bacterium]|nr:NAD-binding protein [Actinomycetota bacterium]